MSEYIKVGEAEGVQSIRFDRADKKNAITSDMYSAIARALRDGGVDPDIAVHLILGSPGIFSAGNDIADFMKIAQGGEFDPDASGFLQALATNEKPIVAAVDGMAVGVGTTLLLHCDVVYASPNAYFKTPFMDLGLFPEAASTLLMPARIGYGPAFEMLCLGEGFDAERAHEVGLVNAIYPAAELEARARDTALALAAKPADALKATRAMMRRNSSEVLSRIDAEIAVFRERLRSPEAKRAFEAFFAQRAAAPKQAAGE